MATGGNAEAADDEEDGEEKAGGSTGNETM